MAPRLRLSVKKKSSQCKFYDGEAVFAEYGAESRNGGGGVMYTSPSGEHGRHMLGRRSLSLCTAVALRFTSTGGQLH